MLEVELRNLTTEELARRFINSDDVTVRLLAQALESVCYDIPEGEE